MNRWIVAALLLLLSACGVSTTTPAPPGRNPPTLEAPAWSDAVQPLTADNAASIRLLGRLDQPETSSTLFDHAVSPDASRLVALSNDEVLSWDLLTGQPVFRTARASFTRLFYAATAELYAVDPAANVSILDAETGSQISAFAGHASYAGALAFDAANDRIAFGGEDGSVTVWSLPERRALIALTAHSAPVTALGFSHDGALLATAGGDSAARLWDWQNGELVNELALTVGAPQRLIFAPTGDLIALGSSAGVLLWSPDDSGSARLLLAGNGGATHILRWSPDGTFLLGGARAGGLTLWDMAAGQAIDAFSEAQGSQISADFSPDGTMLLTSALGGSVALWNLTVGQQTMARAELPLAGQPIYAVEWTDDSRLLLFDATGPVYVWGIGL